MNSIISMRRKTKNIATAINTGTIAAISGKRCFGGGSSGEGNPILTGAKGRSIRGGRLNSTTLSAKSTASCWPPSSSTTISVSPTSTRSPGRNRRTPEICWSFTTTPLVDPASATSTMSVTRILACVREAMSSFSVTVHCVDRPMVDSPLCNSNVLPASGPLITRNDATAACASPERTPVSRASST